MADEGAITSDQALQADPFQADPLADDAAEGVVVAGIGQGDGG